MDEVLVTLGVTLPLVIGIWWLVASSRRDRRRRRVAAGYADRYQVGPGLFGGHQPPAHLFRGQGEAITVAELLREAVEHGEAIRLNWPEDDLDEAGWVRPYVQDQFPTAIFSKIEGNGDQDEL